MSIETTENKADSQQQDTSNSKKMPGESIKKEEMSGDECEARKDQDPPLEIGEHYLVKRGEDSWRMCSHYLV